MHATTTDLMVGCSRSPVDYAPAGYTVPWRVSVANDSPASSVQTVHRLRILDADTCILDAIPVLASGQSHTPNTALYACLCTKQVIHALNHQIAYLCVVYVVKRAALGLGQLHSGGSASHCHCQWGQKASDPPSNKYRQL